MMFLWQEDMVRFMNDASAHSDYYPYLAREIARVLPDARSICDAGCGLGHLACALGDFFPSVTAVDRSPAAIGSARELVLRRNGSHVQVVQADLQQYTPPQPFDAMVFCFFGTIRQILPMAQRMCSGRIVLIKKDYPFHRFSIGREPLRGEDTETTARLLDDLGVPYTLCRHAVEFGQPFRSIEDALRFFRLYSHDPDLSVITEDAVRTRLQKSSDPEFPWYLPQLRRFGLFTLDPKGVLLP